MRKIRIKCLFLNFPLNIQVTVNNNKIIIIISSDLNTVTLFCYFKTLLHAAFINLIHVVNDRD